jgi:hypothetical protein
MNAGKVLQDGREALLLGEPLVAIPLFASVAENTHVQQPLRNWGAMQLGIAQLLAGRNKDAAETFSKLQKAGLYSDDRKDLPLAGFFVEMGRLLSAPRKVNFPSFATDNYDAMGLFAAGLHNWANGDPRGAAKLLERFATAKPPNPPYKWISVYQPLAANLAADAQAFYPLQKAALEAKTPEQIESAQRRLRYAPEFASGGILTTQVATLREKLDEMKDAKQNE